MDVSSGLALLGFALAVGTYGTIIGTGGGFILIPGLVVLFGVDGVEAVGTGAVTLAVIGLTGARNFDRAGAVDRAAVVRFAAGIVPGALLGSAVFAGALGGDGIEILLAALLLALAVFVLALPTDPPVVPAGQSGWVLPAAGIGVGMLSGTLAVGGGLITLPLLARLRGLSPHRAAATTSATAMISSVTSATGHSLAGNVVWSRTPWLVAGAFIGASIGSRTAPRLRPRLVLSLIASGLVIAAAALLLD